MSKRPMEILMAKITRRIHALKVVPSVDDIKFFIGRNKPATAGFFAKLLASEAFRKRPGLRVRELEARNGE